jgi:hypothetical protein
VHARLKARMVRYSFPVGLLHSLLHAGLSRRTDSLLLAGKLSSSRGRGDFTLPASGRVTLRTTNLRGEASQLRPGDQVTTPQLCPGSKRRIVSARQPDWYLAWKHRRGDEAEARTRTKRAATELLLGASEWLFRAAAPRSRPARRVGPELVQQSAFRPCHVSLFSQTLR